MPGDHYLVVEPSEGESYVTFPAVEGDEAFRHSYVLVPRTAPHVPVFKAAPMPSRQMDLERRSMLLLAYYRPWTLRRLESRQRTCPFAGALDFAPCRGSLRVKQARPRGYRRAWKWYIRGHVVSEVAVRLITQVLLQMPADSNEKNIDGEKSEDETIEPLPEGADAALAPQEVRDMLRRTGAGDQVAGISKQVHVALQHGQKLWGGVLDGRVDAGRFKRAPMYDPDLAKSKPRMGPPRKGARTAQHKKSMKNWESTIYPEQQKLKEAIDAWRAELLKRELRPDEKQLQIVDAVIGRCLVDATAEAEDSIATCPGEPMLAMVHGLPGAGKSEVIKWLKELFQALGWSQDGGVHVCSADEFHGCSHR